MTLPFTGTLMEGEDIKLLHHHIKQYEGTRYTGQREASYYITTHGRVARQGKTGCKWLSITKATHKCGYYYQVRLPWINYPVHIHRLVGSTFLPDFQDNLLVCHRQENLPVEYINRVDNLFMGTHSDNLRDAFNKGRKQMTNQYICASS